MSSVTRDTRLRPIFDAARVHIARSLHPHRALSAACCNSLEGETVRGVIMLAAFVVIKFQPSSARLEGRASERARGDLSVSWLHGFK